MPSRAADGCLTGRRYAALRACCWQRAIGVAAIAWQSSYGDAAKEIIARWAPPQRVATSSPPLENPGLAAQPSPPAVEAAGANTAPSQPALLAQTVPEDVAPTAAPPVARV